MQSAGRPRTLAGGHERSANREMNVKSLTNIALAAALLLAGSVSAAELEETLAGIATGSGGPVTQLGATQERGMTLSQAVESVRRRGNVERIVSANTRVEGGREMHHIRYMTKDGSVRTAKGPGRRR